MTNEQITFIYCICFYLTQALEIQDDPQCKMNAAEVMTIAIIGALHKDTLSDVENVFVDGCYSGEPFANGVKKLLHCEVGVAKRNELHIFKVIPKR